MCRENLLNNIIKSVSATDSDNIRNLVSKLKELIALNVLDIYPVRITDNDKLNQVESLYDDLNETDFKEKTKYYKQFDNNLNKYLRFFELLWLKNKEFYVLYSSDYPNFKSSVYELIELDLSQETLKNLKDYDQLVGLISLAIFERLDLTIILPEESLIFTNSDMSFQIFGSISPLVQTIAMTEGLYIRD